MNSVANLNRRSFLITSAAAGGGLAVGLALPFGPEKATAQTSTPEIGAWVVIKPDDTVVVRVVRSEMGQGTVPGCASSSPRSSGVIGTRSPGNIPRRARVSRGSACGAISSLSAVAGFGPRTNMCVLAALPPAKCLNRPQPTNGAYLLRS